MTLGWPGKDCCYGWLLLALLPISRMLCSVAVSDITLPTVPDLNRRKEVARHPSLSAGPAGPVGKAQEVHLLLLRNTAAAGQLLFICLCWFVSVYIWPRHVRRLDDDLILCWDWTSSDITRFSP